MVGKTLGKYRIVEKIGRGGMGIVYRGVDETLDREVAIKVISPDAEGDLARRFRAEAMTLAKVNHPNIATVYELFRDDDRLLMVMELVRGQTFEQLVDWTGPMSVERAASLVGQILDALGHAHSAGIVHRDLKPANLMLNEAGIVKVMDFGIARVAGTERMTTDGSMVGTPAYMAPEQVRGEDVDGRTDLYAVGVVLYRLLTGKLPFRASTAVAMIQSQLNEQPTPAREMRADLPEWLDGVLMRSLAKRPADRYQTAEEFRRALDAVAPLPDDVTVAKPSTPAPAIGTTKLPMSAATPAASGTAMLPGPATLVLSRSHLAVVSVIGLLLVVAIGLLAWVVLRGTAPPAQVAAVAAPTVAPAAGPTVAPPAPPPPAAPIEKRVSPPIAAPALPAAPVPTKPTSAPPATQAPEAGADRRVVPSPAEPVPFPQRGRRGGSMFPSARGRSGASSTAPATEAGSQPAAFRVHALVAMGGGSRMVETTLTFEEKSMAFTDARGVRVRSISYDALQFAFFSRSHLPRGASGVELQIPGGMPAIIEQGQGPRLWLTLRAGDERVVLRIDPPTVRPILDLVEQRTKVKVERYTEPGQPREF